MCVDCLVLSGISKWVYQGSGNTSSELAEWMKEWEDRKEWGEMCFSEHSMTYSRNVTFITFLSNIISETWSNYCWDLLKEPGGKYGHVSHPLQCWSPHLGVFHMGPGASFLASVCGEENLLNLLEGVDVMPWITFILHYAIVWLVPQEKGCLNMSLPEPSPFSYILFYLYKIKLSS